MDVVKIKSLIPSKKVIALIILCLLASLITNSFHAFAEIHNKQRLSVKLQWITNCEFAGMLVAKYMGWYDSNGIDLEMVPRNAFNDKQMEEVVRGTYDLGIFDGFSIIKSRASNAKIRAIAAIFQTSPLAIATPYDSGITSISQLKNKKVGYHVNLDLIILKILLSYNKMSLDDIVPVQLDLSTSHLINKDVDAMLVYEMNQPIDLALRGYKTNLIASYDNGYNFYGEVYYATEDTLKKKRMLISKFTEITLKGWKYALNNPEEAAKIVVNNYYPEEYYVDNSKEKTLRHQILYLKLCRKYLLRGVGENNIGVMSNVMWRRGIQTLRDLNIINKDLMPEDVYSNDFVLPRHE